MPNSKKSKILASLLLAGVLVFNPYFPVIASSISQGAGSGGVNTGTINQLTWYAATGKVVSGLTGGNSSVPITDSSGVPAMRAVPNCTDTGGNHLNFTLSTTTLSCGNSSSGGSGGAGFSGTATLGTGAITSGTCATVVAVTATGLATTNTLNWTFSADPTSATGYAPVTSGMLTIVAYPTSNTANFKVCNNTASSVTPGAVTLNWEAAKGAIATGTSALGTGAITSGTCATVVTTAASGTATTNTVAGSFNGDPTAVTGYAPSASGMLTIIGYPTSNNVNWKVCNLTSSSVTPGAITLNWQVF